METSSSQQGMISRLKAGFEARTLIEDVRRHIWTILALSIAAGLLMYVRTSSAFRPRYSVSATYVVTTRGANVNLISNLTSAQQTAEILSRIVTSQPLMTAVAEDLGVKSVPGSISCVVVQETNLLNLQVTASSPRMAFLIMESVMRNYPIVTDLLNKDVLMRVLVPPEIPSEPSNRNNPEPQAFRAFALCFVVITALFAALSMLKDTIRRGSDVETKLEERCLGSIAHEEKYKTFRMWLRGGQVSMLIDQPACSFRYIESVQKVCRTVQSQMEKHRYKTLLIMSYAENEGKSTVASNLALALAQRGKKVLLMDLDLRNPSLYKVFDFTDEPMTVFGELLKGESIDEPLIEQMEGESLYYIFNTKSYSHSTEILTNGSLEKLLGLFRERFDFIVMDSPPMSITADAEALADIADAFAVVIREHWTWANQLRDMLDTLRGCRAASIGCIINDAHASLRSGGGYGYGADYGGGYGYGKYYGRYYGHYGYGNYGYGNNGKKSESR